MFFNYCLKGVLLLDYCVRSVKVKSVWFDNFGRKKNVFQKIGCEGLYLYFQLYKFKLQQQDVFVTSISLLRKETGYSTELIFELLKKLKRVGVIKLCNVSRWDYLLDGDKVLDKNVLVIAANDVPVTERKENVDVPVSEEDYYISVNLDMFDRFKGLFGTGSKGVNIERYVALYCLIQKWGKLKMSIEQIAALLEFDKDYVHKMLQSLQESKLLRSNKKKRRGGQGYYYEHKLIE